MKVEVGGANWFFEADAAVSPSGTGTDTEVNRGRREGAVAKHFE
jgi:hypothetical protein